MKKTMLIALIFLLLASPALAVKPALIIIPMDKTYTGWVQLSVTGLIVEAGGQYECRFLGKLMTAAEIDTMLMQAIRSRSWGALIFMAPVEGGVWTGSSWGQYGGGKINKYVNLNGTAHPHFPVIAISPDKLNRVTSGGGFYSGVAADAQWAYGTAYQTDSLFAITSVGDTIIWPKGSAADKRLYKHTIDIDQSPENGWTWEWMAYNQKATAPTQGSTVLAWACKTSAATHDSITYFLPNYPSTTASWPGAGELEKMLLAILKRCDVIANIPVSIHMSDYGYNLSGVMDTAAVGLAARTAVLFRYCIDNDLKITAAPQYATVDRTQNPSQMVYWHANYPDNIRFEYSTDVVYATAGTSNDRNVFGSWGDDGFETADSLNSIFNYDAAKKTIAGYDTYLDPSLAFEFAAGNYTGAHLKRLADKILGCVADHGIKKFLIETGYAGFKEQATIYNFQTIFYPYRKYPLTSIDGARTNYADMLPCSGVLLSPGTSALDTLRMNPLTCPDSIKLTSTSANIICGSAFATQIMGNGRLLDNGATRLDYEPANWPSKFCMEMRMGIVLNCHQLTGAVRSRPLGQPTRYDNENFLWLRYYWKHLNAYNRLAQYGGYTTEQVFKPTFITERKADIFGRW